MGINDEKWTALRSGLSVLAFIMWRCVHTATWSRNKNSIIEGMYLGIIGV